MNRYLEISQHAPSSHIQPLTFREGLNLPRSHTFLDIASIKNDESRQPDELAKVPKVYPSAPTKLPVVATWNYGTSYKIPDVSSTVNAVTLGADGPKSPSFEFKSHRQAPGFLKHRSYTFDFSPGAFRPYSETKRPEENNSRRQPPTLRTKTQEYKYLCPPEKPRREMSFANGERVRNFYQNHSAIYKKKVTVHVKFKDTPRTDYYNPEEYTYVRSPPMPLIPHIQALGKPRKSILKRTTDISAQPTDTHPEDMTDFNALRELYKGWRQGHLPGWNGKLPELVPNISVPTNDRAAKSAQEVQFNCSDEFSEVLDGMKCGQKR